MTSADLMAQEFARARPQDLKKLSIEELTKVDVTSVSRRAEPLSHAAAAVSVVRNEDIRRSGAVILAEAMRLGDAVDVGRVNGNTWGISIRGFNISTANKLLVLVDGRSTYSGLFGGTFWDAQDTFLADLDRIELIRGPGARSGGQCRQRRHQHHQQARSRDARHDPQPYRGYQRTRRCLGSIRRAGWRWALSRLRQIPCARRAGEAGWRQRPGRDSIRPGRIPVRFPPVSRHDVVDLGRWLSRHERIRRSAGW